MEEERGGLLGLKTPCQHFSFLLLVCLFHFSSSSLKWLSRKSLAWIKVRMLDFFIKTLRKVVLRQWLEWKKWTHTQLRLLETHLNLLRTNFAIFHLYASPSLSYHYSYLYIVKCYCFSKTELDWWWERGKTKLPVVIRAKRRPRFENLILQKISGEVAHFLPTNFQWYVLFSKF